MNKKNGDPLPVVRAGATTVDCPAVKTVRTLTLPSGSPVEWPDIVKAFTVVRKDGKWAAVELTFGRDGSIEDVKATEPDMMPIALEAFKIKAFRYWDELRKSG